MTHTHRLILLLASFLAVTGCRGASNQPPTPAATANKLGLQQPALLDEVFAVATPPKRWLAEPLKSSDRHAHQVWLSPTGDTAYGIIHFTLPPIAAIIPVPDNWVLSGYIKEMRKDQGDATLLSKERDPDLPGLRFVAEGGLYKTFNNLIVQGKHGWVIYAGILREKPINEKEFHLAEQAREHTTLHPPP